MEYMVILQFGRKFILPISETIPFAGIVLFKGSYSECEYFIHGRVIAAPLTS